jgi:cobalamin biosynthesis protein CobD/CbiB
MNNQSPVDNHQSEPLSRREARRQRRDARQANGGGTWIIGLILIGLGVAFLLQDMGTISIPFGNWWALFILIPAVASFDRAFRAYRNADGHLNASVRNPLFVGVVLTIVTLGFIFNINWTFFGPALIILVGLGILFNAMVMKE